MARNWSRREQLAREMRMAEELAWRCGPEGQFDDFTRVDWRDEAHAWSRATGERFDSLAFEPTNTIDLTTPESGAHWEAWAEHVGVMKLPPSTTMSGLVDNGWSVRFVPGSGKGKA